MIKSYLITHAAPITVNNNESTFRMSIYSYLWKKKTGKSWREKETNSLYVAGKYVGAGWKEETK